MSLAKDLKTVAAVCAAAILGAASDAFGRASKWAESTLDPLEPDVDPLDPEPMNVTLLREGSALTKEALAMVAPPDRSTRTPPKQMPLEGSIEDRVMRRQSER